MWSCAETVLVVLDSERGNFKPFGLIYYPSSSILKGLNFWGLVVEEESSASKSYSDICCFMVVSGGLRGLWFRGCAGLG